MFGEKDISISCASDPRTLAETMIGRFPELLAIWHISNACDAVSKHRNNHVFGRMIVAHE